MVDEARDLSNLCNQPLPVQVRFQFLQNFSIFSFSKNSCAIACLKKDSKGFNFPKKMAAFQVEAEKRKHPDGGEIEIVNFKIESFDSESEAEEVVIVKPPKEKKTDFDFKINSAKLIYLIGESVFDQMCLNRPDDLKNARIADLEATVEVLREKLKRQHGVLRKAKEQKKNLLSENRELTIDRNNFRLKHHQVTVKSKELSDNLEKYNQKLKNRIDEMENEQKLCDQCLSEMNF